MGYAVILLLIAGGLIGGAMHVLVTKVVGLPALVMSLTVGPWIDTLGPPYVATQTFLWIVYILNARASTFLLGAESLVLVLLAANTWAVRSYIPFLNSRSRFLNLVGWVFLLAISILAIALTAEKRPWGFLRA